MKNILNILFVILSGLGAWVSYLTIKVHVETKAGIKSDTPLCNINTELNCQGVIQSEWSEFFGFPLGSYGIAYYLAAIFFLFFLPCALKIDKSRFYSVFFLFSVLSVVFSVVLFLISKIIIGTLCPLCIVLYVINFLLLLINYFLISAKGFIEKIKSSAREIISLLKYFFQSIASPRISLIAEWILPACCLGLIIYFATIVPNIAYNQVVNTMGEWPTKQKVNIELDLNDTALSDYYSGNKNAAIEIVEYIDYECPYCRKLTQSLKELLVPYEGKYYFVIKNFPLDSSCNEYIKGAGHANACYSVNFVRCAGEQGQFWPIHNYLIGLEVYNSLPSPEEVRAVINRGIELFSLDELAMKECMDSKRQIDVIAKDIRQGGQLKIRGTPALWINGKQVENITKTKIKKILDYLVSRD